MKTLSGTKAIYKQKPHINEEIVQGIICDEDNWYLVTDTRIEMILSLEMYIDGGAGLRPEYTYSIDSPDTDNLWFEITIKDKRELTIEDDQALIIEDINGLYVFGMDGVEPPAEKLVLYFRTALYHGFVFADRDGCSVRLLPAMAGVVQDDLVSHMADMIVPSVES